MAQNVFTHNGFPKVEIRVPQRLGGPRLMTGRKDFLKGIAAAAWRAKVEPEKLYADVRALYADHGVDVHILKPECNLTGDEKQTDAELDYWFKAAKALGAKTMTRELPNVAKLAGQENGLRRLAKFCERYDIDLSFHNHTQLNATTYDSPLLDISDRFKINFDIAHYVAANEDDPLVFVKKYHDRIASIHIKDRTTKAHKARTTPFGEGDTLVLDGRLLVYCHRDALATTRVVAVPLEWLP